MNTNLETALVEPDTLPLSHDTVDWGGFAEYFDLCSANNPAFQELRTEILEKFCDLSLPSGPLIDVGAGTGNFTVRLAQLLPQRQIIHLDPERGMNQRALAKARAANVDNLVIQETNSDGISLAPGSVAAALSVHALYACPDPRAVLRQVRGWLCDGGYFIACDLGQRHSSWDWGWYFFRTYWRRHGFFPALAFMAKIRGFKRYTDQIGKSQKAGQYWTHDLAEFAAAFRDAGFEVLEQRRVYRGYSNLVICRARS